MNYKSYKSKKPNGKNYGHYYFTKLFHSVSIVIIAITEPRNKIKAPSSNKNISMLHFPLRTKALIVIMMRRLYAVVMR